MSNNDQNVSPERKEFDKIISEAQVESDLLDKEMKALNQSVQDFVKRNSEVKDE